MHAFRAWASPTPSGRGSWSAHDGAVALPFAAAWNCVRVALSLDAPSTDGGGSSGTHTEPVHLSCRLVARSPAKALGGSSGIERWTMCFAPCVRWPPLCARSSRASGHPQRTQGGFTSHHISSLYMYIYIYMYIRRHAYQKCLPKIHIKCPLFCLRAEQNSVDFFCFFCVFLCFLGKLAFSTLFLLSKHKQKQAF